jgi:hypothetical protein
MSEIRQSAVALQYHCVALRSPVILRARGFHAANIQADADLHTLSSHHRDAVHDMRRADAARIDRTARPQLQFADLSLRSLRFRRKLFEGDVDRRNATPNSASRSKALRAEIIVSHSLPVLFAGDVRGGMENSRS